MVFILTETLFFDFFLGAYFYGMTSNGLNVLDHMYMAEVVAMILVTAMTIQVNVFLSIKLVLIIYV